MTDPLKQRRDALLQELRQLEATLAERSPSTRPGAPESLPPHTATAPQYLVLLDDARTIRYVNGVASPTRPVPAEPLFDDVASDRQPGLRAAMDDAMSSGLSQYVEDASVDGDGQPVWYGTWVVPVTGEGEVCLAVIAADVTRERRIERELEADKSLLESLVAHAPDTVLVVGRDHRIQFINHTRADWRREEVLGRAAEDFVAAEHRDRVGRAIDQVLESAEPTAYETRVNTEPEVWHQVRVGPVIQGGRVTRVSMVSTDITDRVMQERARKEERALLEASERRFRIMVDYAPEALVILDADEGRFIDVNDNACRLFGMTREQLLGSGPLELSPELQPDGTPSNLAAMSRIQEAVEGDESVFEWTHRNALGETIPCEVRLVQLPHEEQRWVRGSIIDISERKAAEAERERLTRELAQSQKLQALGQLTGGVAHDFNNLLTVIMGSMELVDIDEQAPERVKAHARQALAASERAAALTQRLLAFARRQPLRPELIDLNALVMDAEALLRRTLGQRVRVSTELADGLWACKTDPAQLENAILNLAINARDAMPEGGNLTIKTTNVELGGDHADDFPEAVPGDYVRLSVIDDGCGMDDAVLSQVFEPFFTTKPAGQGSGMGLSMVYGFVNQSRGQVRIRSTLGSGTRVDVLLPRSTGAAEPAATAAAADAGGAPHGGNRLVLVVDDDAAVRTLMVRALARLGYRTLDAGDAAAALTLLDATPDVDLLLSDVVLAGGSVHGPELAQRARRLRPALPVLFVSGFAADPALPEGQVPADLNLLEKPFTRDQLGQAVWRAIHPQTHSAADAGQDSDP